ncbi:hypothetical protein PanWU01x14_330040 [Parasponia andersonii]|uniref:Uncharacterized protein n=1 Tax=Parasponia andersonii TaxID=3476 RepID=A0A2P5AI90_PARAD|nr:hypothetical protein PanWU01x14_330040 [Parasponia andersonii]
MANSATELQPLEQFSSQAQTCIQEEKCEETSLVQQSRRPNLTTLQIPARSLETSFSAFTRTEISSVPSPASTRAGLPPRPNSAKVKSSMKSLFPQRSLKVKNLPQDAERTVLIIPDTPPSDGSRERPTTSRSFSLNKVFFSSSVKVTNSLPVTPMANSGHESVHDRHLENHSEFSTIEIKHHMTRSLSVPVNVKARSLNRIDSGGMIRVISATPRPATVNGTSQNDAHATELNVNPILSVLLSSFTGFGIAISTNTLLVEYLRWRTSRHLQSTRQQIDFALQQQQQQRHLHQQQEQYHHHQPQQLIEDLQQPQEHQQENQEHHHQPLEDPYAGAPI